MKKYYIAPEILFEDFSVSTSIAAGCEVKTDLPTSTQCGLKWGKKTLFTDTMSICSMTPGSGTDPYTELCYHNPSEDYNLFNS